jgi:hypothetical protein
MLPHSGCRLARTSLALLLGAILSSSHSLHAADPDEPVYILQIPNPNDYTLFANGGWDGNWYVGANTCWIKKLPPIPPGDYVRAFVGAKLGRMKVSANPQNVWDKRPHPGEIWIGLSSRPAWTSEQSFKLTSTEDIPLEGDFESAIEGVGESQWFWREIPLERINFRGDNFVALWSTTQELISVSSSPVLAAALGGTDQQTWLYRDINGKPPKDPIELGKPLSYFEPAIGLKLVPRESIRPLSVQVTQWRPATADYVKPNVTVRVTGIAEKVWLEYQRPGQAWQSASRPLWKPPYILSIDKEKLHPGRSALRAVALSPSGDLVVSSSFNIEVAQK